MTDKPIIFSAPMVQALLARTKTQTRRVLKLQAAAHAYRLATYDPQGVAFFSYGDAGGMQRVSIPYTPGDRLYVREAHYLTDTGDFEIAVYAEDTDAVREHFDLINGIAAQHNLADAWKAPHLRLRPSIHMPRWASRITLTVTEVRVQRLRDISEADAVAEGGDPVQARMYPELGTCRHWFRDLWNSLHGPDAWDANPWVAAYTFTVQSGNIDSEIANA